MNHTIIGTADKAEYILPLLEGHYLLIDDGSVIDAIPKRKSYTYFDPFKHSFNPLSDMSYKKARDFVSMMNAVFPEGENTLTRKNSNFVLLQSLLDEPKTLQNLVSSSTDPAERDASQKMETLLFSPILKRVLTKTNISLHNVVLARLDRKKLGDFDAFVIAHCLISQYQGQVVIPDFGFYGRPYLSYLLREDRLIAGLHTLSETSLKDTLLLSPHEGHRCTWEDAKTLATYAGLAPQTNGYNDAVQRLMA